MCRAGGRRCKGSTASSRATQTARKQRSRAKQALRHARAAGDAEAIAQAEQRLTQANDAIAAAKEAIVHHDDNSNSADHSRDVTTPKPLPVTGELSDKPLIDNTWGDILDKSPVHYHDDGPVGTAVKYMGADARMEVDGEPLANVVGRIATDVVRRKTKAQQAVNDLKELRDRLPEGSRAKLCLSNAIRNMDGPDTPVPEVPDGTPEPLRKLVRDLHAVPIVRQEPEREMQPLLDLCERVAAGDQRTIGLLDDLVRQRVRNKRHESLGDSGKFEIDDAVQNAVTGLQDLERQKRSRSARSSGDVTPEPPTGGTTPPADGGGGQGPRTITNIADGNSQVGIQAGFIYGDAGQRGDVTGRDVQSGSPRDTDVTNIATGNSHVGIQAGVIFGNVQSGRRPTPTRAGSSGDADNWLGQALNKSRRTRKEAGHSGDVTEPKATGRPESSGTVRNVVHGQNHGIQADGPISGDVHIGPGGIWINGERRK